MRGKLVESGKANPVMLRLATCICLLTAGPLCIWAMSTKPAARPSRKAEVLTVFITGNELGALQPCGCSGGQLGGFDRRRAVFQNVPESRRLIVDTGSFVESDGEQNIIKFNIIIQALELLDYDLVSLSKKDIQIARELVLLDNIGSGFNVIAAHNPSDTNLPSKFTKKFFLDKELVAVTVARLDSGFEQMHLIGELFAVSDSSDLRAVNILILDTDDSEIIDKIAELGVVDCFIIPAESDEPRVIRRAKKKPLVVSAGQFGKYVGELQIKVEQVGGALTLDFSARAVSEDLPQDEALIELYKAYQHLVKEANLLEKQPRFALSNNLEYVGSQSCQSCHEYEYAKWSDKAHAHAYQTLERIGSQYDPECVICHVVGGEYEGGFVSEVETGHLKNVGCENCHGPGSEHVKTLGEAKTDYPKLDCTDCHTPDNSADYEGNEQLYFEKIVHWREPNDSGGVE